MSLFIRTTWFKINIHSCINHQIAMPSYAYSNTNGTAHQPGKNDTSDKCAQEPVVLHPSWEECNLPEHDLNFKNLTMDDAALQIRPPPDKWNIVYFVFLIHGIGVLMTWNMFITAFDYFTVYKLPQSQYVSNFMQYLTFCSQVPTITFNWMNIFVKLKGSLTKRIVWSISVEVVIFLITIILAMIDTKQWQDTFFIITMVCVVLLNMANGIYQNTIFGMAAKLPPKYTGAVILGSNISGTFLTIVSILSKKMTPNLKMAGIYYFITVLFVLLVCFDTFFALPLNRYYRHYKLKEKKEMLNARMPTTSFGGPTEKIPYLSIIKDASPQLFNVFLIFFVTICAFPAIQSNIHASDPNFFLQGSDYVDCLCFLTFNVSAMAGSLLTSWVKWPGPRLLWIFVTIRLLFIPYFLLCNYQVMDVKRILPIYFHNDYVYWVMGTILGLSSGYLSSLAMMYAPGTVQPKYAGIAGMFGAAFLVTGIFTGILTTFLFPWIISHIGW